MKKFMALFLIIFLLVGCSDKGVTIEKDPMEFNLYEGKSIAKEFMKNLVQEKYDKNRELLVKEEANNIINQSDNLKIVSYNLKEEVEIGEKGEYTFGIIRCDLLQGYSSSETIKIKVERQNEGYKIVEVSPLTEGELMKDGDEVKVRFKNDANNYLVLNKFSFPQYDINKEDNVEINKVKINTDNIITLTVGFNVEQGIVTTYDKDSYIFTFDIENQWDKEEKVSNDTPIGKNVNCLDILKDKRVEFVAYSPKEKYMVVQYSAGESKGIYAYFAKNRDKIDFDFENKYPLSENDITYIDFDDEYLYYKVKNRKDNSEVNYKLNLENYENKKVED